MKALALASSQPSQNAGGWRVPLGMGQVHSSSRTCSWGLLLRYPSTHPTEEIFSQTLMNWHSWQIKAHLSSVTFRRKFLFLLQSWSIPLYCGYQIGILHFPIYKWSLDCFISFVGLLEYIWWLKNTINLFYHNFGGQKFKIKVLAGWALLRGVTPWLSPNFRWLLEMFGVLWPVDV